MAYPKDDLQTGERTIDAAAVKAKKAAESGGPRLDLGPGSCNVCRRAKSLCQCPSKKSGNSGSDKESGSDSNSAKLGTSRDHDDQSPEKGHTLPGQPLTPFKLTFTRDGNTKIAKELTEKGEVYELKGKTTLENILEKFESHLRLLGQAQGTTVPQLKLQGYNAEFDKAQGLLTLTFPNKEKKDNFLNSLIKLNMIHSTPVSPPKANKAGLLDPFKLPTLELKPQGR